MLMVRWPSDSGPVNGTGQLLFIP